MSTSKSTPAAIKKAASTKKIIVTWYNTPEKADQFCQWVSDNYDNRTPQIEKQVGVDCYWIHVQLPEVESSALHLVSMMQHAIQDIPTLAEH